MITITGIHNAIVDNPWLSTLTVSGTFADAAYRT
jgi:hypothetical protein